VCNSDQTRTDLTGKKKIPVIDSLVVKPTQIMQIHSAPLQEGKIMKSLVVKRSIVIDGHKTSVSVDDAFWSGLKEIAHNEHATISKMVGNIDKLRRHGNLSSAIRLFVLDRLSILSAPKDRAGAVSLNGGSRQDHI
jgi:predicted DNA-binding ribbon-helix-helix protein